MNFFLAIEIFGGYGMYKAILLLLSRSQVIMEEVTTGK